MSVITRFSTVLLHPRDMLGSVSQLKSRFNLSRPVAVAPLIEVDRSDDPSIRSDDPSINEKVGSSNEIELRLTPAEPPPSPPPPAQVRTKQDLIGELKRNYDEAIALVRKLDARVDQQEDRSARLMEIAERLPSALEAIPDLRQQSLRSSVALDELVTFARNNQSRTEEAASSLEEIRDRISVSREAQLELVRTVVSFRDTLSVMVRTSERVGNTLAELRDESAARERKLAELVASSQKWTMAAAIACGVVALAATVISLTAIFG
jgi:hypothetical protein